jgi:hypothetical protein
MKKKLKARNEAREAAIAGPAPNATALTSTARRYSIDTFPTSAIARTAATMPVTTPVSDSALAYPNQGCESKRDVLMPQEV